MPNADDICKAVREAFGLVGPPKHLISDQQSGFDRVTVATLLRPFGVKQRFGAIGKHRSFAPTERLNKTRKEKWLRRVPVIPRG